MSDNQNTGQTQNAKSSSSEAWEDVGRQFQKLGESLATAFRAAWQDEENRQKMQHMQSGLEAMINEVGQAIEDTAASPEAQQVRSEAKRFTEDLIATGEQTAQEIRPKLLSALDELNKEIQQTFGYAKHTGQSKKTDQDQ